MWRGLRQRHPPTLPVVGGIALYILFGLVMWLLLDWYIAPDSVTAPNTPSAAKKDLMQAWGFIMAGVAGGVGVYFTWRNLQQGKHALRWKRLLTASSLP